MLYFGSKPEEYSLEGCWWTELCAEPPTISDIPADHKDMITLTHSYHDTATRIGQKPHECLLLSFIWQNFIIVHNCSYNSSFCKFSCQVNCLFVARVSVFLSLILFKDIGIICRLWLFLVRSHLEVISQSFQLLSGLVTQWCPVQCTHSVFCENLLKSGLSYRILFKIHIALCEFSTAHIRVCIDSSHNGNILLKILSL